MAVIEVQHPLVQHKIGLMRAADMSTKKFRELTAELARLLTYETCRDFEVESVTIDGWAGPVEVQRLKSKKVTVDRKSTRLNSSHLKLSRMPSSA